MKSIIFCDLCEKILKIEKIEEEIIAKCECGFSKQLENAPIYSEKMKEKEYIGNGIIKEDKNINDGFEHICPKCGHNKCEASLLLARYSDESDIYLYKCKKCNYTDRQADGSSNG